ncbi:MAG: hypothetical protein COB81_06700 [Flavobacteriaceae bacterium]|nr:MAG: hypothetical protein COB81_06700 [Flavobacteriaceae bacterium]
MEKQKLPHAQSSLVFGILSIVTACCCGLPGVVFGLIGWNNSRKAYALLEQNPGEYEGEGNAKTGKITSIIGLILGAYVLFEIASGIYSVGWTEFIQEIQESYQKGYDSTRN